MRVLSFIKPGIYCLAMSIGVTAFPIYGSAHSGGLNAQGCHAGSQPYHCHRSASEMVRTQDGRNRLRCDLGSKSVECIGANNRAEVLNFQIQLMRHCPSLPSNFADGIEGPSTRVALMVFQAAYGLEVDGVYGPQTAAALAGPANGRCQ